VTKQDSDLMGFEDDKLVTELEARGWYVSEYEPEADDFPCEDCASRPDSLSDESLEQIHYLLVSGKNDEAITKIKDLIYDQIGRIS